MNVLQVVLAVIVLGILILAHELGHFIVAKRVGIKVEEFSIGFGPKIVSLREGETLYSIRLLPIGGFVKMAGTNPDVDDMADPRGFNKKSVPARMAVIGAGPFTNLIIASLLFAIMFGVLGIQRPSLKIMEVLPGTPAALAGLKEGDEIKALGGERLSDWEELVERVSASKGKELTVVVRRNGLEKELEVTPEANPADPSRGFIGITPRFVTVKSGPVESLKQGIMYTFGVSFMFIKGLFAMLLGRIPADVAGPVGIAKILGDAAKAGIRNLLYLVGLLSANLGILNLLPFPALDGSRLVFLGIEGVRQRPVDPEKENLIHFIGFTLLMLLALLVTYRDILRISAS
ncbi:MAG TPA: RIP metalloprotease RseP [Clostridia bacterium]|nr:RIP metalloprotease RseP [Clostridia bacterium]